MLQIDVWSVLVEGHHPEGFRSGKKLLVLACMVTCISMQTLISDVLQHWFFCLKPRSKAQRSRQQFLWGKKLLIKISVFIFCQVKVVIMASMDHQVSNTEPIL